MSSELGKYKPYPEYNDSCIEWIGQVPSHWSRCRIKNIAQINPSKSEVRSKDPNSEISFLPMEAISDRGALDLSRTKMISEVLTGYTYLAEGDVMLAKITPCFENGKAAIAINLCGGIAFATTEVVPLRPKQSIDAKFIYYLITSNPFKAIAESSMYGAGGQKRVADSFIAEYLFSLPPLNERKTISLFLDYETARIDRLIAKQQQLIELLKEKRQAVISHVVTKGLNPDAPMKDSGVEWLGQVPEHWNIKRLKHISPKIGVGLVINPSHYVKDNGVFFLFGGDVTEYGFKLESTRRMSELDSLSLASSRLKKDDLVCVRVGYPGITAVIPQELDGANCASIMVIRRGYFISQWLAYAFNSQIGRQQVSSVQYGAAQKQFNIADAIEFIFPVPPCNEQQKIAEKLDQAREQFNELITKAEQLINYLYERRKALISAAVTGKIDLREWVEPVEIS